MRYGINSFVSTCSDVMAEREERIGRHWHILSFDTAKPSTRPSTHQAKVPLIVHEAQCLRFVICLFKKLFVVHTFI